jgi:hypothetical protein
MWTSRIHAQNQLYCVDTCSSNDDFRDFTHRFMNKDDVLQKLTGQRIVFLGSTGERSAGRGSNGPFAQAVMNGFAGKAPHRGGKLMAHDLQAFLALELRTTSDFDEQLYPDQMGDDFPLATLDVYRGPGDPDNTENVFAARLEEGAAKRHGKDYALVIGTSQYRDAAHWRPIPNAVNDVKAIGETLTKTCGFKLYPDDKPLINPLRQDIVGVLTTLAAKKATDWQDDDQLLIYIASHGDYEDADEKGEHGVGYIACKDTRPGRDITNDSRISYQVLSHIVCHQIKCKHVVLVLDVCKGGSIFDDFRDDSKDPDADISFEEVMANFRKTTPTRLCLTSAGKDYLAPDGHGQHSPFAQRFLDEIAKLNVDKKLIRWIDIVHSELHANEHADFGRLPTNAAGSDFLFIRKRD